MVDSQILFRVMSIFIAMGVGFFSYRISIATKGALKGWHYATITGVMFFFWATFLAVFTFIDIYMVRVIAGILFLPATVILSISIVSLSHELGINRFNWFNVKNVIIVNIVLYAILLLFNLLIIKHDNILVTLVSVTIFVSALSNIVTIIGSFMLYSATKSKIWILFILFGSCFLIGELSCSYWASGCTNGSAFENTAACDSFDLDYEGVIPFPVTPKTVQISSATYNFLPIGAICLLTAYGLLWKTFTGKI